MQKCYLNKVTHDGRGGQEQGRKAATLDLILFVHFEILNASVVTHKEDKLYRLGY